MKHTTKRIIYNVIILALLIVGAVLVFSRFVHLGGVAYTDNAQVRQHITPVHTRVPGFIKEIRFEEFQTVHKGDTLVIIEDSEFRLHLAQANADLAQAMAGKRATSAGIATTSNNLKVSDAGIEEARVQYENAERERARFEALLAQNAVTRQQYDQMQTAAAAAKARYEQVSRAKGTTSLVRAEQGHRLSQTEALVELAEASVQLAQLNLSYTVILAPCDGIVGRKDINVGQMVNPGQVMCSVVDASEIWVIANFRETQIAQIAVGRKVSMTIDAVPGITYHGQVEAIADATGASYAMVPTDNATGNFVKVEQRIPVRIRLVDNDPADVAKLRSGINVECEVEGE